MYASPSFVTYRFEIPFDQEKTVRLRLRDHYKIPDAGFSDEQLFFRLKDKEKCQPNC